MEKYPKIYGPFRRFPEGMDPLLVEGRLKRKPTRDNGWTKEIFDYLQDAKWYVEEKLDGTNMRIIYDGENKTIDVRGRSDNAHIFPSLKPFVTSLIKSIDKFIKVFGDDSVCLYGEGIGPGINDGGDYGENRIVIFDILKGDKYLDKKELLSICNVLRLESVPTVLCLTLNETITMVSEGFYSNFKMGFAEGVIARPCYPLVDRYGDRVICKIKHRDFYNG